MVSDTTRNLVWQDMLDAARLVRYYEKMSSRYSHYDRIIRSALFLSATGIMATVLDVLPQFVKAWGDGVLSGVIVVVLMLDFLADFRGKTELLSVVSTECSELVREWDRLWNDLASWEANDNDIRARNGELDRRITMATARTEGRVPVNEKLNLKCANQTYRMMIGRYATDDSANAWQDYSI